MKGECAAEMHDMERGAAVERLMCCRSAADGVRSGRRAVNVIQKETRKKAYALAHMPFIWLLTVASSAWLAC